MNFHILGVGAIGGLVAHHLRRVLPTDFTITLIHKTVRDQLRLHQKGALTIQHASKEDSSSEYEHEIFHSKPPPKLPTPTQTSKSTIAGPIDSLFVALKANHTLTALQALAPRLSSRSTIVLLQNGMGIYEQLLENVFRNPAERPHFILTSNSHGAFATDFYHILHAGVGSIEFAIAPDSKGRDFEAGLHDQNLPLDDRRLRLTDISSLQDRRSDHYHTLRSTVAALLLLENLGTSWNSFSTLQLVMRQKLTVNAVINSLTALVDCRNGDLFEHKPARELLVQICDEASAVFLAQMTAETESWLKDLETDGIDPSTIQFPEFPEALRSRNLQKEVLRVAAITRQNISSTLGEVRRGRITEIDFLNGYLVDLGREYGVSTPVNAALANVVRLKSAVPLNLV